MPYEPRKRAEKVAKCSPCLHTVCPKKKYSSTPVCVTEGPSFSRVLISSKSGGSSRNLFSFAEVVLYLPVRQKFNHVF